MEARSRLSIVGTPSIVVYFDKSDLANASGDVASIFLSALNTDDYRLAMSVRTTHLVQWIQKTEDGSEKPIQDILSNNQISELKKTPNVSNVQIIRDEGMYLTFFAADKEMQQEIQKTDEGNAQSISPQLESNVQVEPSYHHPESEKGKSLEGFMRQRS